MSGWISNKDTSYKFCIPVNWPIMDKKKSAEKPSQWGGNRLGSGRPRGTKFGEMTSSIRLPIRAVTELKLYTDEYCMIRKRILESGLTENLAALELEELGDFWRWLEDELSGVKDDLPTSDNVVYMERYRKYAEVSATPKPVGDTGLYYEEIEVGNHLIGNPQSTYILDVVGDSMIDEGIYNGTILIVEEYGKSHADLLGGEIVVASLGASLSMMVKVYHRDEEGRVYLISANPNYAPIVVDEEHEHFLIQGIVKKVFNKIGAVPVGRRNQYMAPE